MIVEGAGHLLLCEVRATMRARVFWLSNLPAETAPGRLASLIRLANRSSAERAAADLLGALEAQGGSGVGLDPELALVALAGRLRTLDLSTLPAKGVVETLYRALKVEPRFEAGQEKLMHPGKTARLEAGSVGELHPALLEGEWGAFELDLGTLFASAPERTQYQDVVTYPAIRQDLAFAVAESVPAAALVDAARKAAGPDLREMRVFDVYRGPQVGEGKKSIAFSVSFQSPERTLSDEDAAELRNRIVSALGEGLGAELRGG